MSSNKLLGALFSCLLWAGSSFGAISIVQVKSGQSVATSTPLTVSSTGSGNELVAMAYEDASSSATLSMSDGASQTWTTVKCNQVGTSNLCVFIKENTASGITSVTCNSTTSATLPCVFMEISGLATSSSQDGNTAGGSTSSSSSLTSGGLTTTNANDILIFAVGFGSTTSSWSATAPFSLPNGNLGNNTRGTMITDIVSATQSGTTATATGTSSTDRNGIIFALSNTPIGGGPPGCKNGLLLTGAGC